MSHHVTYEDAMATLQSMFGGVDREVIGMVLQSNNGHVEKTVENLLAMTGGAAAADVQQQSSFQSSLTVPSSSSSSSSYGGAQSVLPDDFLRPPSYFIAQLSGPGRKGSMSQLESDAILAQMLQDELFMAELQQNPHLYDEQPHVPDYGHQQPQQHPASHAPATSYAAAATASSAAPAPSQPRAIPAPAPASSQSYGNRGDFSSAGSNVGGAQSSSFRERWNNLTSSARAKLLAVANRLRAPASGDAYRAMDEDGGVSGANASSSERAPAGLPAQNVQRALSSEDVEVYRSDDPENDESYQPPAFSDISAQPHRDIRKGAIN